MSETGRIFTDAPFASALSGDIGERPSTARELAQRLGRVGPTPT